MKNTGVSEDQSRAGHLSNGIRANVIPAGGSAQIEPSLQISVLTSLEALESLRPAWEDLLCSMPAGTIFNTWEWLTSWWRAFGHKYALHVLAFHGPSGRLVGLAPFSLSVLSVFGFRLHLLRLLGDGTFDSDNLDLLVRPGWERPFTLALLAYLGEQRKLWDVAQLNTIPSASRAANELLARLEEACWTRAVHHEPCSVLFLPNTWESYINQLSKKQRDKLAYYTRRIEKRYRQRVYRCAEQSELPTCLHTLFCLHQKRWQLSGELGTLSSDDRRAFYNEITRLFLARGWLEFWLLDLNGETAAAQLTFRYRDTVSALQEGFDPSYSADSVGFVLRGYAIRQLIGEGVRCYDFLGGTSDHKDRWGVQTGSYLSIQFARPLSRGSFYLLTVKRALSAKELMRRHLPACAWAVLHWLNLKIQIKDS